MAVYLEIVRVADGAAAAEYTFALVDGRSGRLRLDKPSGEVSLITPLDGDDHGGLFARAARKVSLAWAAGALPARLSWAS